MKKLIDKLRNWWTFRDVVVTDAGLSMVAGKLYLDLYTTSRFKGVILAEISARELEVLAEMISDEDLVGKPSHSTGKCDISQT